MNYGFTTFLSVLKCAVFLASPCLLGYGVSRCGEPLQRGSSLIQEACDSSKASFPWGWPGLFGMLGGGRCLGQAYWWFLPKE